MNNKTNKKPIVKGQLNVVGGLRHHVNKGQIVNWFKNYLLPLS